MSELRLVTHLDSFQENPWILARIKGRCGVANGCFDVLHSGHLHLLRHLDVLCRLRGVHPVVALNSDQSLREIKGQRRPIVPQGSRAELLTHLYWPMTVVIFDEPTPQRLMDTLEPPLVLKGSDYDPSAVVRWSGSEVRTVELLPGWSTSALLEGKLEEDSGHR